MDGELKLLCLVAGGAFCSFTLLHTLRLTLSQKCHFKKITKVVNDSTSVQNAIVRPISAKHQSCPTLKLLPLLDSVQGSLPTSDSSNGAQSLLVKVASRPPAAF